MTRLLKSTGLIALLALAACQPALHGVPAGPDADAQLCRQLVEAYQASDWEALPVLAPRAKALKAIYKQARRATHSSGEKPIGPPPQKKLERAMITMAQTYLDSSGIAPKDLHFAKVEPASTLSTGQGPIAFRQDWLVMRGPSGNQRQEVFVMEFEGRVYVASLGPIIRAEE